jgi:DnaJ-class molecular chaperone
MAIIDGGDMTTVICLGLAGSVLAWWMMRRVPCPRCYGFGYVDGQKVCPKCLGTKEVEA